MPTALDQFLKSFANEGQSGGSVARSSTPGQAPTLSEFLSGFAGPPPESGIKSDTESPPAAPADPLLSARAPSVSMPPIPGQATPDPPSGLDRMATMATVMGIMGEKSGLPFLRENRTGVEDVALGLVRGTPAAVEGIGSAMQVPAALMEQVLGPTAMSQDIRSAGEAVKKVGGLGTKALPAPNTKAGQVAQGAAPLATAIGAGALTGGAGGLAVFAGTSAAPVVGQVYERSLASNTERGVENAEGRAALEAAVAGGVSVVLNRLPAIAILQKVPGGIQAIQNGVMRAAAKFGWGALAEGFQEGVENVAIEALRMAGGDPEAFGEGYREDLLTDIFGGGTLGGMSRFLVPNSGIPAREGKPDTNVETNTDTGAVVEGDIVTPDIEGLPRESRMLPVGEGLGFPADATTDPAVTDADFRTEPSQPLPEDTPVRTKVKGIVKGIAAEVVPGGGLPRGAYEAKLSRDSRLRSRDQDVEWISRDLRKAIKATKFDINNPDNLKAVNDYLRSDPNAVQQSRPVNTSDDTAIVPADPQAIVQTDAAVAPATDGTIDAEFTPTSGVIPEPVAEVVRTMRSVLDRLSKELITHGIARGDVAFAIDENGGVYVTRAYRAAEDPKYTPSKADRANFEMAVQGELRRANPDWTNEMVANRAQVILSDEMHRFDEVAGNRSAKLGKKNLGVFEHRGAIPDHHRQLWGEITDPLQSWALSMGRVFHILENHKLLSDVRRDGLGTYLFEANDPNRPATHTAQLAAPESDSMSPLNGLYTTPEIAQAFDRFSSKAGDTDIAAKAYRGYLALNAWTKAAKTVGSVITHVRNFISRTGMYVAQGHVNPMHVVNAGKMMDAARRGDPAARMEIRNAIEDGIIGTGTLSSEIIASVNDARLSQFSDTPILGKASNIKERGKRAVAATWGAVQRAYRAEDDVWSLASLLAEQARFRKAFPDATQEQIRQMAVRAVQRTAPNYDRLPEIVKTFRKLPLKGGFVAWPAEVIRTSINTFRQIADELKVPATQGIALERLGGVMMAAGAMGALVKQWNQWNGIDDEEKDSIRRTLPSWSQNGQIVVKRNDDGTYTVTDLSWSDPYAFWKNPAVAVMRGADDKDIVSGIIDGVAQMFSPFTDDQILADALLDVGRNFDDETGRPVWNETDTGGDIAFAIATHIGNAFLPGTVGNLDKIKKGTEGFVDANGRAYNTKDEILAVLTGTRSLRIDPKQWMQRRGAAYRARISQANERINTAGRNMGTPDPEGDSVAQQKSEASRRRVFDDMMLDINAARTLGMSNQDIVEQLKAASLGDADIASLVYGRYIPYRPSLSGVRRNVNKARSLGIDPSNIIERARTISDNASEDRP